MHEGDVPAIVKLFKIGIEWTVATTCGELNKPGHTAATTPSPTLCSLETDYPADTSGAQQNKKNKNNKNKTMYKNHQFVKKQPYDDVKKQCGFCQISNHALALPSDLG